MNKRWINIVSFIASNRGHKDIIEYLLTKGADINVKAIYGWTPLHYGEYILNIIPNRWINIVSFTASRSNHKIIFEYLLSKGADVNVKDKFGDTPLHLGKINIIHRSLIKIVTFTASSWGHKDIVEVLLSQGAYVNVKDNYGLTPLYWGE